MKKFIKNNEGVLTLTVGLMLVTYGFINNGYIFEGWPTGAIIVMFGSYLIISKYFFQKKK